MVREVVRHYYKRPEIVIIMRYYSENVLQFVRFSIHPYAELNAETLGTEEGRKELVFTPQKLIQISLGIQIRLAFDHPVQSLSPPPSSSSALWERHNFLHPPTKDKPREQHKDS